MARAGVEIVGDASKYERALKKSETATKRWASKIEAISAGTSVSKSGGILGGSSKLLAGGGIALGAGIAADKIMDLTNAASDLNEQVTKNQAVFGTSSQAVERWSDTTAKSMGISKRAALEATGTFGNLFSTVGVGQAGAAKMSEALVQLTSDLASFNNADPSDVLDAIRSGLIGEAEPLRRYGVLLSETRVQQQAMADTGKTNVRSLTSQEKALARYKIILQDTGKAHGDFEKTQGSLANQQRKLAAQQEDLKGKIGKVLLPVMTRFFKALNDGADKTGDISETMAGAKEETQDWTDKLLALKEALRLPGRGPSFFERLTRDARKAAEAIVEPGEGHLGGTRLGKPKGPQGPTAADRAEAARMVKLRNDWFDALIGRKIDRVQDAPLRQQIADLDRISKLISDRIAKTKDATRKLTLEDELLRVARDKQDVRDQIAAEIAEKQQRRLANVMGFLSLGLAKAETTEGIDDDVKQLRRINEALRRQIAESGQTPELLQQIFDNEQAIKAKRDQVRQERLDTKLDWLEFGLEKADATKSIKDNVALEKKIIAFLKGRVKTEGQKLELVEGIFRHQQALKNLLHQKGVGGPARASRTWGTGSNPFGTGGAVGGAGAGGAASGQNALVRRGGGFVVVNQHFNAPTTDRHREARYALNATRAVFDG